MTSEQLSAVTNLIPDFAPYSTDRNFAALDARASQLNGSATAWRRAFAELQPTLQRDPNYVAPRERVSEQFRNEVRRISSSELLRRLREPDFKRQFDLLAIEDAEPAPTSEYQLTAAQWRALPPETAAIKMREPNFRAAVDRLIARGEI